MQTEKRRRLFFIRKRRLYNSVMENDAAVFLQGLTLNAGLIVAIGAQNAFVLAQGLSRKFVGAVALICAVCDALLIVIGIAFSGIAKATGAADILVAVGIAYLCWFGFRAARAAVRGQSLAAAGVLPQTLRGAIAASLALSLLNPHAILDMAIVFGGVAANLPAAEKTPFAAGGICTSFIWFFALGFGARKLAPHLRKPAIWRFINGGISLMMFAIAFVLLRGLF